MRDRAGIYVETLMHAPMDVLWEHTQTPALHQQWDLRFTSITYLPRTGDAEPQLFRYATRILPGVVISGEGETIAVRTLKDGSRTSSLRFNSLHPLSLIREGSGYWKYIPTNNGIRFLTWYDYQTRWGVVGRLIDRLMFRPLMGWATAWSFDRLRLWIENGQAPSLSVERARIHALTLGTVGTSLEVPKASRCLRVAPDTK